MNIYHLTARKISIMQKINPTLFHKLQSMFTVDQCWDLISSKSEHIYHLRNDYNN